METLRRNIFLTTVNNKQSLLWLRNGLSELRSRWLSFWSFLLSSWQETSRLIRQYVTLGCLAGKEIYSNDRHFVGFVGLMVSPVFWWAHLFFDHTVIIEGWFYKNFFFWFFTNREELMIGTGLLGFFLLCPTKWNYRFLITPIIALCYSEVIYQSFQISHWTHFYNSLFSLERGWELAVVVVTLLFALSKFIDYTVYRKCHLRAGNKARRKGLDDLGLTDEEKEPYMEILRKEYEDFNNRI